MELVASLISNSLFLGFDVPHSPATEIPAGIPAVALVNLRAHGLDQGAKPWCVCTCVCVCVCVCVYMCVCVCMCMCVCVYVVWGGGQVGKYYIDCYFIIQASEIRTKIQMSRYKETE